MSFIIPVIWEVALAHYSRLRNMVERGLSSKEYPWIWRFLICNTLWSATFSLQSAAAGGVYPQLWTLKYSADQMGSSSWALRRQNFMTKQHFSVCLDLLRGLQSASSSARRTWDRCSPSGVTLTTIWRHSIYGPTRSPCYSISWLTGNKRGWLCD